MLRLKSNKTLLISAIILLHFIAFSQKPPIKTTSDFFRQQNFRNPVYEQHKRSFLWLKTSSPIIRYNPVSLGFGLAMYTYQNVISPQFSAGCLYSPSCSEYSKTLIKENGLIKGILFTADRLTRCNRMAAEDIKKSYFDHKDHKVHESTDIYHVH